MIIHRTLIIVGLMSLSLFCKAQTTIDTVRSSPVTVPGKGLYEHDFLYAGEGGPETMFIIKGGSVVWTYTHPAKGEISDAVMLSNGNILFAHQFGITLIDQQRNVLWNYDVPDGNEVHTAVPIGNNHVLFVQNGKIAKVIVINIKTNKVEKEFEVPVGNPEQVHPQFRHARLTNNGTLILAHMDLHEIVEYNSDGKAIWSLNVPQVWGVTPLKNGNVLVAEERIPQVEEYDQTGKVVWSYSGKELPGFKFGGWQMAYRLDNGNTIINNWTGKGNKTPVQFIEVNKQKKLVWALRSWDQPADLGPSTILQIIDNKNRPENVRFGNIR
nr:hypothetical protein [Mucilaginibacter sp. X5P1]